MGLYDGKVIYDGPADNPQALVQPDEEELYPEELLLKGGGKR